MQAPFQTAILLTMAPGLPQDTKADPYFWKEIECLRSLTCTLQHRLPQCVSVKDWLAPGRGNANGFTWPD